MSLFNWFSGKPGDASLNESARRAETGHAPLRAAHPPGASSAQTAEMSRLRRHARREQLFNGIREAMTRSGVLSARYKFKVLSLDQIGNEFMVMMDLSSEFGGALDQLIALESAIIRHAKARHDITVPTVYWRIDGLPSAAPLSRPAPLEAASSSPSAPAALAPLPTLPAINPASPAIAAATASSGKPTASPASPVLAHKPPTAISPAEVAAFQQALRAASAKAPATVQESGIRTLGKPRSYTLLTGFEDTEMPDAGGTPGLSRTQYGDLK
jgi:hypothetical protein